MIDKEKLIKDLKDRLKNREYYINVNSLLTDLKNGRYDVDKYYKDDEDV